MRSVLGLALLLAASPPVFGGSTSIQVRADGMKVIVNEPSEARTRRRITAPEILRAALPV